MVWGFFIYSGQWQEAFEMIERSVAMMDEADGPAGLIAVYARSLDEAIEKAKHELELYNERNS